jgi:hypothetical protein
VVAFQQGDDACVTVTPATSVPTSSAVTGLPVTGEGQSLPASPASIFMLLGGATLLAAGAILTLRKPTDGG